MPHGVGLFLFPASAFVVCHTFRIYTGNMHSEEIALHFQSET